jgi:hypothetical protein
MEWCSGREERVLVEVSVAPYMGSQEPLRDER